MSEQKLWYTLAGRPEYFDATPEEMMATFEDPNFNVNEYWGDVCRGLIEASGGRDSAIDAGKFLLGVWFWGMGPRVLAAISMADCDHEEIIPQLVEWFVLYLDRTATAIELRSVVKPSFDSLFPKQNPEAN